MIRAFAAALALFVAPGLAQAETAAERQARCAAQAQIVTQAATLRAEGKREKRTIRMITKARAGLDAPYSEAIPVLTSWVYTLPQDQLSQDVTGEFMKACSGYKP